ncbi:nucleotidyltransferase [Brachybacterium avium]|uniref:Nucleotidyltransferase n=1 Tax=Brachybacterium avium TaxID=2017485 RepID=A0A220UBQ3_9MICO|nr:nucleotidyltransferase domain-containing protein [Brachybacterium avium]ASK65599.1 nucleotidyltransferase [Brachybacterium avium]
MAPTTEASQSLRETLSARRGEIVEVLLRYGAHNPRVFGSVARGDAMASSDIDLLVDLEPHRGNELMRVAGIGEELSLLMGVRVDVVTASLLRDPVSRTALADAVSL